ncbi:hypothetical protein GOP47_0023765 [Adiantum capillus-veneris]|uniref:Uncharacterized protein n=1 Tax=Adiantum capillus-veneris TaxID=13818 RepID=A0A9D4U553_ADICA|nr:hypothetical protein GOP47_0023765 [Adiantum capillus-veneris]
MIDAKLCKRSRVGAVDMFGESPFESQQEQTTARLASCLLQPRECRTRDSALSSKRKRLGFGVFGGGEQTRAFQCRLWW